MFASYFDLYAGVVRFYATSYSDEVNVTASSASNHGEQSKLDHLFHDLDQQQSIVVSQAKPVDPYISLQLVDSMFVAIVFINLLLLKRILVEKLHSSSLLKKLGLRQKDCERLDECLWRLAYYTFTSILLIYSCFFRHQSQDFLKAAPVTTEYSFDIDGDEYAISMIEIGFYLHAIYALIFEDVWRHDSPMMLIHHVMAVAAITSLYTNGILRLGLAIIVLRDTVDVLLELAKLFMCFRIQHGKLVHHFESLIKWNFIIFTIGFTVNQLYLYPLNCLYHLLNVIATYRLQSFGLTCLVSCAVAFLVLDLLWFTLIINLLYKMLFLSEPLEDLREYERLQKHVQSTTGSDQNNICEKIKSN